MGDNNSADDAAKAAEAAAQAAAATAAAAAEQARKDAEEAAKKAQGADTPPWGDEGKFDAETAWNLIKNLRNDKLTLQESAAQQAAKAAEDAAKKVTDTLAKALGLVPDEADPVKLQEKIAATEAQARQSSMELAVYRAAEGAGANALALLDSRAFMAKVQDIDPTNLDAVGAAITAVLADNPSLAKTVEDGTPRLKRNPGQGSSAGGAPSLASQLAAAEAKGDTKLAVRLKSAAALQSQ